MTNIPIPLPIIIPDDDTEYICPEWVNIMLGISTILFCLGTAMILFCAVLEFCFDKDAERVFRISLIVCVLGAVLLLLSCVAMIITGEAVIK